jgi:hypothetical protein
MNLNKAKAQLAQYRVEHAKIAALKDEVDEWAHAIIKAYAKSPLPGIKGYCHNYIDDINFYSFPAAEGEKEQAVYLEFSVSHDVGDGWLYVPIKYFVENGLELIAAEVKEMIDAETKKKEDAEKEKQDKKRAAELAQLEILKKKYPEA